LPLAASGSFGEFDNRVSLHETAFAGRLQRWGDFLMNRFIKSLRLR
jgi:hypothetical protein